MRPAELGTKNDSAGKDQYSMDKLQIQPLVRGGAPQEELQSLKIFSMEI
jgi:hypothetical protein